MTEEQRSYWLRWRFIAAIIGLAGVWLVTLLLGRSALDRTIYEAMYAGGHPLLILLARIFTALGEPTVLIVASAIFALWMWRIGRARVGLVLLLITITGRALSEAQKYWIARPRPDLEPQLVVVKTNSFPSGHAMSSMIFYVILAIVLTAGTRRQRPVVAAAILLSLFIGTSRVMLGVHWPSDVIGGWAVGLLWVLLTWRPAEHLLQVDSAGR
jgi:undecaprenyl-diphosphatase